MYSRLDVNINNRKKQKRFYVLHFTCFSHSRFVAFGVTFDIILVAVVVATAAAVVAVAGIFYVHTHRHISSLYINSESCLPAFFPFCSSAAF